MTKPPKSFGEFRSDSAFHFKQFSVRQRDAAMKVGFDGILLGAWCWVAGYKRILDVGTGTGLIALMIAQRTAVCDEELTSASQVSIEAVEIDEAAANEARSNFANSRWQERLRLHHQSFQTWRKQQQDKYDLVVSNPPFFSSHLTDTSRAVARQESRLNWGELIEGASMLLTQRGRLSLIIPYERAGDAIELAGQCGLFPCRKLVVRSIPHKSPHRVLLEFGSNETTYKTAELTIELSRHVYTPEFRQLTRDFYVNF